MKLPLATALSLTCALAGLAIAAEPAVQEPAAKPLPRIVIPPDASTTKGKTAPAAKAPAAEDAKAKGTATKTGAKKEEEPKIEGVVIARGKGYLGLQVAESVFKLSFYDEKKKPVAADVDKAALRWDPRNKIGEERVLLTPSEDGKALTAPKAIKPPYNFKVFMTLIKEGPDGQPPANENFVVDFRQ